MGRPVKSLISHRGQLPIISEESIRGVVPPPSERPHDGVRMTILKHREEYSPVDAQALQSASLSPQDVPGPAQLTRGSI